LGQVSVKILLSVAVQDRNVNKKIILIIHSNLFSWKSNYP
jgi:hypothetical protein